MASTGTTLSHPTGSLTTQILVESNSTQSSDTSTSSTSSSSSSTLPTSSSTSSTSSSSSSSSSSSISSLKSTSSTSISSTSHTSSSSISSQISSSVNPTTSSSRAGHSTTPSSTSAATTESASSEATSGALSLTSTSVVTENGTPSTIFTAIVTSLNSPPRTSISGSEKIGIVVGSALGGFAFILLMLAAALVCRRYRRRNVMRMRKALPTPRRIRLEDEDEMDLAGPGLAFLGRPAAQSGSIFQESVWPPPSSQLEDPLKTSSDINLSSVVDDVMGQSGDDSDDVNARLISNRELRESGSGYRFLTHSRDPSMTSNYSDTPLLSRTLLPNWQNRSPVFANEPPRASLDGQAGSGALVDTTSVAGSGSSSYSEASAMRSRGDHSHEPGSVRDENRVLEIPPLYHTIVSDAGADAHDEEANNVGREV